MIWIFRRTTKDSLTLLSLIYGRLSRSSCTGSLKRSSAGLSSEKAVESWSIRLSTISYCWVVTGSLLSKPLSLLFLQILSSCFLVSPSLHLWSVFIGQFSAGYSTWQSQIDSTWLFRCPLYLVTFILRAKATWKWPEVCWGTYQELLTTHWNFLSESFGHARNQRCSWRRLGRWRWN